MKKKLILSMILAITLLGCSKDKEVNRAAVKMQDFVVNIAQYARGFDSEFIIVPQNGIELAFQYAHPTREMNPAYILAVDGFGVEELFYNGSYSPDYERLNILQQLTRSKTIMVSEYVSNDADIDDALNCNYRENFICFPRASNNYDYSQVPNEVFASNLRDILKLSHAVNYLCLLNTDHFSSKEDMLNTIAATDYDLVIIDLFFNETALTPSDIDQLRKKANGRERLVMAYINIGAAETFRYYWKDEWDLNQPDWIKKQYEGYHDEYWVEFWNPEWQNIIYGNDHSYIKKIIDAGFDGAYLDNVEAYYFLYHNE